MPQRTRLNLTRTLTTMVILISVAFSPELLTAQSESPQAGPLEKGIYVNPLGFVQFGPTIGMEFPAAENGLLDFHVRLQGLGALAYALNDDTELWQTGIGMGYRSFLGDPQSLKRFYVGGIAEFVWSPYADDVLEGTALGFAGAGQFGHRWRRPSGVFINLGAFLGVYYEFSDEWNFLDSPNIKSQSSSEAFGFYMLELSFGKEIR